MFDKFPVIKGYGFVMIDGKKYEFKNRVNSNFLGASQTMLDVQLLTKQTGINPNSTLRFVDANVFSLLSEEADYSMRSVYTSLADINLSAFECVQASMYKSTIRGAGVIATSGTVRTGGFNVIKFPPILTVPNYNCPKRVTEISLTVGLSLPSASNWIYHDGNKALYLFTTPNIYKIPFDINTGVLGSLSTISTNWTLDNYYISTTDGKDNLIVSAGTSGMLLKIFNFPSDTVIDVPVPAGIPTYSNPAGSAWDENLGAVRNIVPGAYGGGTINGYVVTLDGNVIVNTGDNLSLVNTLVFKEHYALLNDTMKNFTSGNNMGITTSGSGYDVQSYQRIMDNSKITVIGNFNSTSPSKLSLTMLREPETAMTLYTIPTTNVVAGQSFVAEYTFEVMDRGEL